MHLPSRRTIRPLRAGEAADRRTSRAPRQSPRSRPPRRRSTGVLPHRRRSVESQWNLGLAPTEQCQRFALGSGPQPRHGRRNVPPARGSHAQPSGHQRRPQQRQITFARTTDAPRARSPAVPTSTRKRSPRARSRTRTRHRGRFDQRSHQMHVRRPQRPVRVSVAAATGPIRSRLPSGSIRSQSAKPR